MWVVGILLNELSQYLDSKAAEVQDLLDEIRKGYETREYLAAATNVLRSVGALLMFFEDLIDLCDLLGPVLALLAMCDELYSLYHGDYVDYSAMAGAGGKGPGRSLASEPNLYRTGCI